MLHAFAANQVAEDTASRSPDSRKAAHEAAEVIQAARRLVAIDPGSARYRYLLAATFQDHDLEAQMSELRSALQAAERARCEWPRAGSVRGRAGGCLHGGSACVQRQVGWGSMRCGLSKVNM